MSTVFGAPAAPNVRARASNGGLVPALKAWWLACTAWRIERLAIARLRAMSDRQLKDIGIVRSQIELAVRSGAGRDRASGGSSRAMRARSQLP